jgi:hypothetical protein
MYSSSGKTITPLSHGTCILFRFNVNRFPWAGSWNGYFFTLRMWYLATAENDPIHCIPLNLVHSRTSYHAELYCQTIR